VTVGPAHASARSIDVPLRTSLRAAVVVRLIDRRGHQLYEWRREVAAGAHRLRLPAPRGWRPQTGQVLQFRVTSGGRTVVRAVAPR
jgi:hypothetical protein